MGEAIPGGPGPAVGVAVPEVDVSVAAAVDVAEALPRVVVFGVAPVVGAAGSVASSMVMVASGVGAGGVLVGRVVAPGGDPAVSMLAAGMVAGAVFAVRWLVALESGVNVCRLSMAVAPSGGVVAVARPTSVPRRALGVDIPRETLSARAVPAAALPVRWPVLTATWPARRPAAGILPKVEISATMCVASS